MLVERGLEPVEENLKPRVKRSKPREPLGFVYFGLVVFLFLYFAHPQDWIPGMANAPLAKITGVLIIFSLVLSIGKIRWQLPLEIVFLSLLIAQLWLAVVFSPVWRGGAFNVMLDFSKVLPLVFVIYWTVRSMKRLQWILFVQGASVAAIAIASIVYGRISAGRLEGLVAAYGNSNDLAIYIDISLPLCLALALTTRNYWKKLAWTFAILAMIYAVFQTASRAGAIALVVVALICFWQIGVKSRHAYVLLLVPVALIVIWVYAGNGLRERFEETNKYTEAYQSAHESTEQRTELLVESLRVTARHPLFGVGPGNFSVVSGVWHVAHNSYTQMGAEGGIPAFLLYVLILWRGIVNLRDIRKHQEKAKGFPLFSMALEASFAAYLVGSFFASLQYQLFPYCLVAYTSALRLIVLSRQMVSSPTPKSVRTPSGLPIFPGSPISSDRKSSGSRPKKRRKRRGIGLTDQRRAQP